MDIDIAVRLPREAETVSLVRATVRQTMEVFGVSSEGIADVSLALGEACNNVIQHADSDDDYEVRFGLHGHRCEISVKNLGQGFDFEQLSGLMPGPDSAEGRGVAIMQAVMDQVKLTSDPEAGTVVHLVRDLDLLTDGPLDRLHRPRG